MTENIHGNSPERITVKHMLGILAGIFNLEYGIIYTMWGLTTQPGKTLQNYLFVDRSKFLNPLRFLFLSSAIATLLNVSYLMDESDIREKFKLNIEEHAELNAQDIEVQKQLIISELFKFLTSNQNLIILAFPLVAAIFTLLFFRKSRYYFGEHLAINCFAMAYMNVVYILLFPLIYHMEWVSFVYYLLSFVFLVWVYFSVYNRKGFSGVLYASLVAGFVNAIYFIAVITILVLFLINKFSYMIPTAS